MAARGKVSEEQARRVELLWGERAGPTRGPKPGLSIERITRAAMALADADGMAAVSLQRVASEFGFTTTSLYRYVPGKEELVDLMVDMAAGEPPDLGRVAGSWRPRLEAWARQLWDVFHRHHWLLGAATARSRPMGPNELAWLDSALGALAGTNLSEAERFEAVLVLNGHVRSMAEQSLSKARGEEELTAEQWGMALGERVHRQRERFPALAAVLGSGAMRPSQSGALEFGMRCLLDGLALRMEERARAAPTSSPSRPTRDRTRRR